MTIYKLGGLRIASDFPLFGVHICQDEVEESCEVVIRCAPIPEELATAKFRNGRYSGGTYNGTEVVLARAVGRFLLRAGSEIVMDLPSSSNPDEVRAYLLGAVFGALCHQRGITPLHASAIDLFDGCVAFVGASGAGKSTCVAALARRGYEIISDDECFLRVGPDGEVLSWPGLNGIRLWQDARIALGFDDSLVEKATRTFEKYFIPLDPPRNPSRSRRLRRVYQLHRCTTGTTEITRLRGADAVEVLMQNVYPPNLAYHLGYQTNLFNVCTSIAREIPVFRLSRPWDLWALDECIDLLDAHLNDRI